MKWYLIVAIVVGALLLLTGAVYVGRITANTTPSTSTPVPSTATPAPTMTPVPPTPAAPAQQPATDRIKRLVELDKIYRRNQGIEPWLKAAGFTWTGALQEARQVEEETIMYDGSPKIVASGVQLRATNFHACWPGAFTTDKPFSLDTTNGRSHKPDPTNPSVLVTNGIVSGTLTAWVDCSNWAQLAPPR